MKKALLILLALVGSVGVAAGGTPGGIDQIPVPDAGASVLLLSIGVAALGAFRRSSRP